MFSAALLMLASCGSDSENDQLSSSSEETTVLTTSTTAALETTTTEMEATTTTTYAVPQTDSAGPDEILNDEDVIRSVIPVTATLDDSTIIEFGAFVCQEMAFYDTQEAFNERMLSVYTESEGTSEFFTLDEFGTFAGAAAARYCLDEFERLYGEL